MDNLELSKNKKSVYYIIASLPLTGLIPLFLLSDVIESNWLVALFLIFLIGGISVPIILNRKWNVGE